MQVDSSVRTLGEVLIFNHAQLRSIALKIVGTTELADDVLQEAYLKLVEGAYAREVEKPFNYCCQVVRNLALDYYRRRSLEDTYRIYTEDGELPHVPYECTPEKIISGRQLIESIDNALGKLPPRTRNAFELYRLSGLTQREIAKELDCSVTLVNFMIKDAVEALMGCKV
ncbi:MAG: RNA polymerase subunit sigma-70 [Cellvibrio sp. 79]|nr:MAG: RNA polymerase subunit sigma-70 [Cellvibrio sp. 79]